MNNADEPVPVLEARGIEKNYGAVRALDGVDLRLFSGEVLALIGDNGAGKSTLVRSLSGVERPDGGHIVIDGRRCDFADALDARAAGIETVHQDLGLVDTMDIVTNLFLNREVLHRNALLRMLGVLDRKAMRDQAAEVLTNLRIRVPSITAKAKQLSGGQRQAVAVGRAAAWGRHIVLMDEPTAALGVEQARHVLELLSSLRERGLGVVLISHNMQDVMKVCDRAVVLRHGSVAGDVRIADVEARDLVDLITGAARFDPPVG
jgi:simple sugar transport system ATP-binding protein